MSNLLSEALDRTYATGISRSWKRESADPARLRTEARQSAVDAIDETITLLNQARSAIHARGVDPSPELNEALQKQIAELLDW
jgi:hypothetical protein